MKGRFLVSSNEDPAEGNIYAEKMTSSVEEWEIKDHIDQSINSSRFLT